MLSSHHRQPINTISDTFGGTSTIQELDHLSTEFHSGVRATHGDHETSTAVKIFDNVLAYTHKNLLMPLLLRRSVLCREMDNLEEALNSARQAIQLDNTNADGHIAAVQAFVAQGSLTAALRQCAIGLSPSFSKDRRRKDLQLLQQQLYEHVNHVNQWPFDDGIVERIIRMIHFSERLCFAATCRHWRNRIYNLPATWEDISIIPRISHNNSLFRYMTAYKIRHLAISTDNRLPQDIYRHWNQLESLDIITGNSGTVIPSINMARMLVQQNRATLRQLEVEVDTVDLDPCDMFSDLLSICPNLTRLKIHKHPQPFPRVIDNWLLAPAHPIPLTQLIFVNAELNWLKRLIPKCPQLQHLVCVPKRYGQHDNLVLELANQHCPCLQSFRVGEINHLRAFPDNSLVYWNDATPPILGLEIYVSWMDDAASQFLERNHLTLEGLSLPLDSLSRSFKTLITLAQVNVPRLRKLDIRKSRLRTQYLSSYDLSVILQNCPALEVLWIADAAVVNDNLLYSLHRLSRLRELEMTIMHDLDGKDSNISTYGLNLLFSTASCLRDVHLILNEPISIKSCLSCIAQSTSLTHLALTTHKSVALSELDEFATSISAPLQSLKIKSMSGVVGANDDSLKSLTSMPHITHVQLTPCWQSFVDAMYACSKKDFKNKTTDMTIRVFTQPVFAFTFAAHKKHVELRIYRRCLQQY